MDLSLPSSEFEWDKHNIEHIRRHDVEPFECEEIFFNEDFRVLPDTTHSKIEERFIAIGKTNSDRYLFVSFTLRGQKIRVITARGMNQKERRQ